MSGNERPDVKSEYYIDPDTGQRYVNSKLGGATAADGADVGEVIIKDLPAEPADYVKEGSDTLAAGADLLISNMDGYKTLQFTVSGMGAGVYQTQLGYDTDNPPTLVSGEVSINDLADVVTGGGQKVLLSVAYDGDYVITDLSCKSVFFDWQSGTTTPTITWKARKT